MAKNEDTEGRLWEQQPPLGHNQRGVHQRGQRTERPPQPLPSHALTFKECPNCGEPFDDDEVITHTWIPFERCTEYEYHFKRCEK